MKERRVLGVAGMPGAGKEAFKQVARNIGYPVVVMGDEVRKEAKKRKLKASPETLGALMLQIRAAEGPAAIAKRSVRKMREAKGEVVVIEGIRSVDEVNEFKKHFPNFTLIAIHASPETRFRRLSKRNRSDDPNVWDTFRKRDTRELDVGVGGVIATADHMIVNEGTKTELNSKIWEVLKEIRRKWTK